MPDKWQQIFNMPFVQRALFLILGIALMVFPDSSAIFGIKLRGWVENAILAIGAFITFQGFTGFSIESVETFLRHAIMSYNMTQRTKKPPDHRP